MLKFNFNIRFIFIVCSLLLLGMFSGTVFSKENKASFSVSSGKGKPSEARYLFDLNKGATTLFLTNSAASSRNSALSKSFVRRISLQKAVKQAQRYSSFLLSENAKLLQEEAKLAIVSSGFWPKIDFRGNAGLERSDPASFTKKGEAKAKADTHFRWDTSLTLKQTLLDFELWGRDEQKQSLAKVARSNYKSEVARRALGVVNSYFDLMESRFVFNLTQDYGRQLSGLMRYVKARSNAGVSSSADEDRVKGRVLNIRASAIEIKGNLKSKTIGFRRLTGVIPGSIVIPQPLVPKVNENVKSSSSLALRKNLDILTSRLRVQAAADEASIVSANYYPNFSLNMSDNRSYNAGGSDDEDNSPNKRELLQTTQQVMVNMNINLFNGGADYYRGRLAAEKIRQRRFELEEGIRRAKEAIEMTVNSYKSARLRIAEAAREERANLAVVKAYIVQIRSGNRSVSDVLDAYQRLYTSRVNLVKLIVARARLGYQALNITGKLRDYLKV